MFNWLDFFGTLFLLIFASFFFFYRNFFFLFLLSELVWIFLYVFVVLLGCIVDDLTLISLSFYVLGFAGVEFSFGFLLLMYFRQLNESLIFNTFFNSIETNEARLTTSSSNKFSIGNYHKWL